MSESAALLVAEVFPHQLERQWVLSFPFQLRFLFASHPVITGQVLGPQRSFTRVCCNHRFVGWFVGP